MGRFLVRQGVDALRLPRDEVPKAARIAVLVNPANLPTAKTSYEAYAKLHVPLDCKLR